MKLASLICHINICLGKMSKYMSFILDRMRWSFHKRQGKLLWNTFERNFSKSTFYTVFYYSSKTNFLKLHHISTWWSGYDINRTLASLKKKKKELLSMLSRELRCWVFENFWPSYWSVFIMKTLPLPAVLVTEMELPIMNSYNIVQAQVRFLHPVFDI